MVDRVILQRDDGLERDIEPALVGDAAELGQFFRRFARHDFEIVGQARHLEFLAAGFAELVHGIKKDPY